MLAETMRPKLKAGVYYIPLSDGVYLRGNSSHLMLKGKSLYPLVEHLIPLLDGNATIEELTSGLDSKRKDMITHLLEKLFASQLLTDANQSQIDAFPRQIGGTYAANLAFVESFQVSAVACFEHFCQRRLLLLGSGRGLISLVQASLRCGVKRISVIATPEDRASSHQDIHDFIASCDVSEQSVQLLDTLVWGNRVAMQNLIRGYDAVLHIADRPMIVRAQLLNRLCVEEQKAFIQAIIIEDRAWVGPLVCAEAEGCWECAWRRLQAHLANFSTQPSHYEFYDRLQAPVSHILAMPEMTMIANQLLFALFKSFTKTDSIGSTGHVSVLDLKTGLSKRHTFLPHPHCQACRHSAAPTADDFLEQIQKLQCQRPLDRDSFLERLTDAVIDPTFGLFTTRGGDDFAQVPLAVDQATLSDPMLQKKRLEILTVATVQRNVKDRAGRIAQEACTRYAADVVDHRRLFPLEAEQCNVSVLSADQESGASSTPGRHRMGIWALDLQTKRVCSVPVEQVFPALFQSDQGTCTGCDAPCAHDGSGPARGIASGMSWEEAICQALLDWCNYLTVEEVKNTRRAYAQVDLSSASLMPEGTYLYRLLRETVGQQLCIYDVTGSLGVPTFATCFGEQVLAYATHYDEAHALGIGFERALQRYQAEHCQQLEYVGVPAPALPSFLRASRLSVPRYGLPTAWPARQEWLLQRLRLNGFRVLVIPLDHDPALARILPFIVQILLSSRALKKGE
jgi:putative thiazole-containing bacteriocin maturation protein